MAGYDFEFTRPDMPRSDIRQVLEIFRRAARVHHLEFHYRTSSPYAEEQVYCKVDGPLDQMQLLVEALPNLLIGHSLSVAVREGQRKAQRVAEQILFPLLNANEEAVERTTSAVFELADHWGGLRVNPYAVDYVIEHHSRSMRLSAPQRFALSFFHEMFQLWRSRDVAPQIAVVTFDQSFELFLKSLVGIASSKSINYPKLLEKARVTGIITGREAYRLNLFHRTRNRCQHRGYNPRRRTVDSFATFGRDLLRRLITDNLVVADTQNH